MKHRSALSQCFVFCTLSLLLVSACEQGPGKLDDIIQGSLHVDTNPFERVPLGAMIRFRTEEPVWVRMKVQGTVPVKKDFPGFTDRHSLPVLGLYADTVNTVDLTLIAEDGSKFLGSVNIETAPLPDILPTIRITKIDRAKMEPGMHLVEMLIGNNGKFLSYTILFDDNGDIRWFMDMSDHGEIVYTNLRLANGNWLYLSWIDVWELNGLGEEIRREKLWNYAGNHHVMEVEGNRMLFGGSRKDATVKRSDGGTPVTRYDHVVLWDRNENKGVKHWDLGEVLDIDRAVYPDDFSLDLKADWFHINGFDVDPNDNSLIISGRQQGVLKVDSDNNLKWIMAPQMGWGRAGRQGRGFNTADFLLTAVDSVGVPFPTEVQQGLRGPEQFEWSTGQHAPTVLSNGNILLFDNGLSRNLAGKPTYSRAVEYKVDDQEKTIEQVWQYGRERGLEFYSAITSDVDVLPVSGNRLITSGNIRLSDDHPHAKLVEITYPENEEVFEAMIFFKDALGTGERSWAQFDLVFRGERYSLYPE